ncbi:MAG: ThuA domain-containing protein, partial [Candidatus Korobacteraceae bacterium]
DEPILLVVSYGKGRVFHTMLGNDVEAMRSVGFITTLQRGAEWAANGKVTIKVPSDFPRADKESLRPPIAPGTP